MIEFRNITLDDRELVHGFMLDSGRRNCELSFANLCSWGQLYGTQLAVSRGFLLLRMNVAGEMLYVMPVGEGDVKEVLQELIATAASGGARFRMVGVCAGMLAKIEEAFPSRFSFSEDRDFFDYIYLRTDLATLSGKKYQPKRNHVNRFKRQFPGYEYQELTPALVPECLLMEEEWCRSNGCDEMPGLADERRALTFALRHMDALGLKGGVLRVDGRIVAFTYGAPVNRDTWDVCVEKADTSVDGAYAMINYEYANRIDGSYMYVNREEDLGLEGLRKAKLSYQPAFLLEKYVAELCHD